MRRVHRLLRTLLALLALGGLTLAAGGVVSADGGSSRSGTPGAGKPAEYEKGVEHVESGNFTQARRLFERARTTRPNDPEVLNMLAYTQRKTGQLDRAIETYKRALSIKPDFPQAREYLAEAYLQATLRELKTLEGYGASAVKERAHVMEALRKAASGAQAAPATQAATGAATGGGW